MTNIAAVTEGFIGKKEVAQRINRSVRTVESWMRRGVIPYYKIGHIVSFRWSELESHIASQYKVCRPGPVPCKAAPPLPPSTTPPAAIRPACPPVPNRRRRRKPAQQASSNSEL